MNKTAENVAKMFGWIFIGLLFLLLWQIGQASQSAWIGVIVGVGILLAYGGTAFYTAKETLGGYLTLSLLSFIALSVAVWLSGLAGGWWWTGVWLIVALAHFVVAIDAWQEDDDHMRVALILGILHTLLAFLAPTVVLPSLQARPSDLTGSIWLGFLVGGLMTLILAWHQGRHKTEGGPFIFWALISLGLLAGATWFSKLQGGWLWSVPWLLAGLVLFHAAQELRDYSFSRTAGNWGLLMVALCLIVAFAAPALLPDYLEGTPSALTQAHPTMVVPVPTATVTAGEQPNPVLTPVSQPAPAFADWDRFTKNGETALQNFFLAAFRSIWGIFHLLMLFVLGYLWFGTWRKGALPSIALVLAIWLLGAYQSPYAQLLIHLFSSSPARWMHDMLMASIEHWGTMGWGILLTGAATVLLLLPAFRITSKVNYVLALNAASVSRLRDSSVMRQFTHDLNRLGVHPVDNMLAFVMISVVSIGLFIALWMGLRQLGERGNLPLGFIFLPDLTVPHWAPVWDWAYFLLAFLMLLATNLFIQVQKKSEPTPQEYGYLSNVVVLPAIAIAAALFPAGVLLFSLSAVLTHTLFLPLRVQGISRRDYEQELERRQLEKEPGQLKEERDRLKEERRRLEEERDRLKEELRQLKEKPGQRGIPLQPKDDMSKAQEAKIVWTSQLPLISMLPLEDSKWFLSESGVLFVQAQALEQVKVPIQNANALFALKESTAEREGEVLVIGDGQKVLRLGRGSRKILQTFTLSQKGDAFTLNPYKTMVAWLNVSEGIVGGMFLEAGHEVTFASGLAVTPALAFSADGRHLAAGAPDGRIHLINVATRQVETSLQLPESSVSFGKSVRYLAGRKGGGWLAVYENRRTVLWDSNYQVEQELPARKWRLDTIAFHAASGRLAFGMNEGHLQVFDAGLKQIFACQMEEKQLSWMDFSSDGKTLFVIGNKTIVRKVELP
jgi:hypothetical protein